MSIFGISLFGNEHVLKQGRHLKTGTNKVVELSRRVFDPHTLQSVVSSTYFCLFSFVLFYLFRFYVIYIIN